MTARPGTNAILLAFAGVYLIWGTTFLGIALAIRTIPPFFSGALRFFVAAGLMYAWLRARTPRPFAGLNIAGSLLCGVLLSGVGNGFVIWAQQGLPSGITALFICALPVMILLFDWLFFSHQAPTPRALAQFGERWKPYRSAAAWYLWRAVDLSRVDRLPRCASPPRIAMVKAAKARRPLARRARQ